MMRGLARRFRRFLARGRIGLPGREGFSLVEILMVLIILSIGILPVVIVQHRSRREISESDRYSQAITLAQAQMERIKGKRTTEIEKILGYKYSDEIVHRDNLVLKS